MTIKFGIIGCGFIGKKRFANLPKNSVTFVCDRNLDAARDLCKYDSSINITTVVKDVIDSDVDAIIVATPNNLLYPIARSAIIAGKHVLLEKPGCINLEQISDLENYSKIYNKIVKIGYNHRYHPACLQAMKIVSSGELGDMMFVRGRYGHGGRLGYETEWRADRSISGGGELIDQGVHLIDLSSLFLGEFTEISGHTANSFWNMSVEDNAFLNLRTVGGATAWLHVSCSEWKNLFSFEIYGKKGKLHWEGLGGSYGVERLSYYKMLPEMGPPDTFIWEYPKVDESWKLETLSFIKDIESNLASDCDLAQGRRVLSVVDAIYKKL